MSIYTSETELIAVGPDLCGPRFVWAWVSEASKCNLPTTFVWVEPVVKHGDIAIRVSYQS